MRDSLVSDRALVEAHIAELRRRGTVRRDAVKGFRGARVKDERSKADEQLALADAIERAIAGAGTQAGGGTDTTFGVSSAAQPGDCPSSGESGTASPGPATVPCEFCAETFPCEKCATARPMTTHLALELASVAMAADAGECPCVTSERRCGSCRERAAADALFTEWLRDLTPGISGLEPNSTEWWRAVARKLAADYWALNTKALKDERDAERWDALREALGEHGQITLTAFRERGNRSVMLEYGRIRTVMTPNYASEGDEAPSVGAMLDEAMDCTLGGAAVGGASDGS